MKADNTPQPGVVQLIQTTPTQLADLINEGIRKQLEQLKKELQNHSTNDDYSQSKQLLTIDEVSALLHLTKPTIYSKVSKNELPGVCKQGKRLYFDRHSIINWIKQGRKKSNAEIEAEAEAYLSNNKKGLKQ
jgi:excisionase family DNA binding protein